MWNIQSHFLAYELFPLHFHFNIPDYIKILRNKTIHQQIQKYCPSLSLMRLQRFICHHAFVFGLSYSRSFYWYSLHSTFWTFTLCLLVLLHVLIQCLKNTTCHPRRYEVIGKNRNIQKCKRVCTVKWCYRVCHDLRSIFFFYFFFFFAEIQQTIATNHKSTALHGLVLESGVRKDTKIILFTVL